MHPLTFLVWARQIENKKPLLATSKPQAAVNQKGQPVQTRHTVQQKSPNKAQSVEAEAELTALEIPKKRRSTGHVSITSSTVAEK
ncbi:hypothetical protein HHUSO_G13633 [Huso huso]|uniref:Uncharacterized protein n=1 Tax=Huso huso TaxID=61971 RepID=A0ABR0ZGQ8_HUSHU